MAAFDGDPIPPPLPWESLARQAREIAALASEYALRAPEDLAPRGDDDDPFDALADLDVRAHSLVAAVAVAKRDTWIRLEASGCSRSEIARMWGVSRARPGQIIDGKTR